MFTLKVLAVSGKFRRIDADRAQACCGNPPIGMILLANDSLLGWPVALGHSAKEATGFEAADRALRIASFSVIGSADKAIRMLGSTGQDDQFKIGEFPRFGLFGLPMRGLTATLGTIAGK
jgi:hypothetical protein